MSQGTGGSRGLGALALILSMVGGSVASAGAPVPDAVQPEPQPVAKNRFISFVPGNAGQQVALRVTLGQVWLLPDRNGTVRWVGPPAEYDDCEIPESTYWGSALQCTPHYMDWGAIPVLHVTSLDDEVLPDSIYAVQAIFEGDDTTDEANHSAPLIIPTPRVYTDSVGWWNGTEWTAPDGIVSFQDIAAGFDKVGGLPTIPHVRVKMTRGNLLTACVGFDAVDNTIDIFRGTGASPFYGGYPSNPCGGAPLFACGNGVLEPAEECDDGGVAPGDGCDDRCLSEPACGNGIVDPGEGCDDGGTTGGDGCDATCQPESVCGNGILEPGEQCDDGGTAPLDGCDPTCQAEGATAVLSLVPVGSTGPATITGNEIVLNEAGHRISFELRLSNWDPDQDGTPTVSTYQSSIDASGFNSGVRGSLFPAEVPCCGIGHPDGLVWNIDGVDVTGPGFRYGGAATTGHEDDGNPKYVGSLTLGSSEDAAGTFTVGFLSGYADTFLFNGWMFFYGDDPRLIPFAELRPAVVTINSGCCFVDRSCASDAATCDAAGETPVPLCLGDCDGNGRNDACDLADGLSEDCNGNLVLDSCDIASGTSADCNGNAVPDDCEADCQPNGVQDDCDIADGTSDDCNANDVPDECEANDCQPNGVPDDCDIADGTSEDCNFDGVPDECQPDEDCNGSGTKDLCDIGDGSSFDCNLDLTPDECQLARGASADNNGNGIPDECEEAPVPDPAGLEKNRTISLVPSTEHAVTALRVTLVDLYNTDPDVPDRPACPPRTLPMPELSAYDGAARWVGPPAAYPADVVPSAPDLLAAPLQCCPHFRDWSPVALAEEYPGADTSIVHLYGAEMVPCSRYAVEAVSSNCTDLGDPTCYSEALELDTAAWGDVASPYGGTGEPSFIDIGNVVLCFKSIPLTGGWNKPRCLLRGNVPPLEQRVNFIDIGLAVNGFKSLPYPNDGPGPCDPCP